MVRIPFKKTSLKDRAAFVRAFLFRFHELRYNLHPEQPLCVIVLEFLRRLEPVSEGAGTSGGRYLG